MLLRIKKFLSVLITIVLLLSCFANNSICLQIAVSADEIHDAEVIDLGDTAYSSYIEKYSNTSDAKTEIKISATEFSEDKNAAVKIGNIEKIASALIWESAEGEVSWQFTALETALYEIHFSYYQLSGRNSSIDLGIKIDGVYPFDEAKSNSFDRIWRDDSEILTDKNGDEYTPSISESPEWTVQSFRDTKGYYRNAAYKFYITEGTHTLTLISNNEPVAISYILLKGSEELPTYKEVSKEYKEKGLKESDSEIKYVQAEDAHEKSDYSLRAQTDKISPLTVPFSPIRIRYNCIGGDSWKYQSQWINWIIDVPKDGLYKIALRYKQDLIKGYFSSRRLYIDGKVPFLEADSLKFDYSEDWLVSALGGDEPYLFYLTEGKHEIKLEVVTGEISQVIDGLQGISEELMGLYRRIIAITGTSPDQYRDYHIAEKISDMTDIIENAHQILETELSNLEKTLGMEHVNAGALQTLLVQLEDILRDPDTIVDGDRLGTFSSNVSSFSSWLLDLKYQPLTIDWFALMSPKEELPRAEANIIEKLTASVKRFVASFAGEYTGNESDENNESITVWLTVGRDQAQILKNMASDSFTANTGIAVNIRLVSASLVQAVLAKNGPDIAIMVARDQPVNLAIRNALVDLSKIDGFEEIKADFNPTAFEPYCYMGGCYGIPDSQIYPMMFYRTDIFEELRLECPDTWEEFLNIAPILQRNNMRVGIPSAGTSIFSALLMQQGAEFYNESKTDTNWDTPEAYDAFLCWTKFYTQQGFSLEYSFNNLFRTGEMPIGIADYNMYNTLKVTAPEIDGMWKMVQIPGTLKADGSIDRSINASGTASIIFKNSKNPTAAWQFIKWWTGTNAQSRYATDMESVMGISARQTPANIKALQNMNWSKQEYDALKAQANYVTELSELPGGYYVTRNLANAFNDVVLNNKNPRESLEKWTYETTLEIKRKFKEFGIEG